MWNEKKIRNTFSFGKNYFFRKMNVFFRNIVWRRFSDGKSLDFLFVEKKRVLNLNEFYDKKLQCPNFHIV